MSKKLLIFIFVFICCGSDGIQSEGYPEPFFTGGVEDMSLGRSESISNSSASQGDYIIKTAYASTDVSSSNFNSTINCFYSRIEE